MQHTFSTLKSKLVVLVILDGLGISTDKEHNAVVEANTPFLDTIWTKGRKTLLYASGTQVGLPDNEVGNSEVGHLNIGAGRVVYQSLPLINDAIVDGSFKKEEVILNAIQKAKEGDGKLHLMGILSAGGIHGHISHLFELLQMCKNAGVHPFVHAFMDGRDVGITDGVFYIKKLLDKFKELETGTLASMSGRLYSMDRDNRWERVKRAYDSMTGFGERKAKDPFELLQNAYLNDELDEILIPTTMVDENDQPVGAIQDGDVCIMYNFREDRARETIKAFAKIDFDYFERRHNPENITFVSMMGYGEGLNMEVVYPPRRLENTLASVISDKGLNQLHISETEKYAHVTYFFNGGVEETHKGEDFVNIPSKKVNDYAETPKMSADLITDEVLNRLGDENLSFIVINFANPDMLGHTGDLKESAQSVEYVDLYTKKIVEKTLEVGGIAMVTSDHGNVEVMYDTFTKQVHTAHTLNPVPFILVSKKDEIKLDEGERPYKLGFGIAQNPSGMLADIAPTVLDVLNIDIPADMTGNSLLEVI